MLIHRIVKKNYILGFNKIMFQVIVKLLVYSLKSYFSLSFSCKLICFDKILKSHDGRIFHFQKLIVCVKRKKKKLITNFRFKQKKVLQQIAAKMQLQATLNFLEDFRSRRNPSLMKNALKRRILSNKYNLTLGILLDGIILLSLRNCVFD